MTLGRSRRSSTGPARLGAAEIPDPGRSARRPSRPGSGTGRSGNTSVTRRPSTPRAAGMPHLLRLLDAGGRWFVVRDVVDASDDARAGLPGSPAWAPISSLRRASPEWLHIVVRSWKLDRSFGNVPVQHLSSPCASIPDPRGCLRGPPPRDSLRQGRRRRERRLSGVRRRSGRHPVRAGLGDAHRADVGPAADRAVPRAARDVRSGDGIRQARGRDVRPCPRRPAPRRCGSTTPGP